MLLGATRPGSAAGELMRYVTQFKMWPTAAMSQMIGREIYMSLSKKEMAANLFTMAALSAAFGYMRMSINDMALGHPPRNPLEPQTMLAGLAQGGGLGIMGDFLFGETNRMGGGLLERRGRAGGRRCRHAHEDLQPLPVGHLGPERPSQERRRSATSGRTSPTSPCGTSPSPTCST